MPERACVEAIYATFGHSAAERCALLYNSMISISRKQLGTSLASQDGGIEATKGVFMDRVITGHVSSGWISIRNALLAGTAALVCGQASAVMITTTNDP